MIKTPFIKISKCVSNRKSVGFFYKLAPSTGHFTVTESKSKETIDDIVWGRVNSANTSLKYYKGSFYPIFFYPE